MDEIGLKNPRSVDEWMAATNELLAHHPGNQSVYIQVTRGAPQKRDHVIPKGLTPTVFMMCYPLSSPSAGRQTLALIGWLAALKYSKKQRPVI